MSSHSPDWTPHDGGECPVHRNHMGRKMQAKLHGGGLLNAYPESLIWRGSDKRASGDVIAWRWHEWEAGESGYRDSA